MLRSLRKVAASLEKGMETAFSSPPSSHTAFIGKTFTIAGIKIKLGSVFAEGGYSLVHIAKPVSSASTTTRYAVKRILCEDPEARNQAEHEIAFLRQLPPHPNIVRFYDAIFQHDYAFLLFELVDGGTLPERLKDSSLDSRRRLSIFADAVAAVAHLHAQNPPVAIRDVKLENLLFDRLDGCYKLCDFGSVTTKAGRLASRKEILAAEEDVASNCTAMYRAPELVDLYSKHFICERIDVWALGCIWYAILFGDLPFDGQSSLQISQGLQHVPSQPTYPDEFISLLKGMLNTNPAERMDSFSALETVTRLQGKRIDLSLQSVGIELRRKRARDFGDGTEEEPTVSFSNVVMDKTDLSISLPATSPPPIPMVPFSSAINASPDSRASWRPISVHGLNGDTEGWADFESAFGSSPSVSRDTAISGGTDACTTQELALTSTGCNPKDTQPTANTADVSSPLIDLSDLHVSHRSPRAAGVRSQSNQRSIQSESADGVSTSKVTDLIDFG